MKSAFDFAYHRRAAGHQSNGRGTLLIDRLIQPVGRIKRASGTRDPHALRLINAAITELIARRDFGQLEALKDGRLHPGELISGREPIVAARVDTHHLYVFRAHPSGKLKIGIAGDVAKRLSWLRDNTWETLELVAERRGMIADERALHAKIAAHRIRGEWYEPAKEVLEALDGFFGFAHDTIATPQASRGGAA